MQDLVNSSWDLESLRRERSHLESTRKYISLFSFIFIHLAMALFLGGFFFVNRLPLRSSTKFIVRVGCITIAVLCLIISWCYNLLVSYRFKRVLIRWSQMEGAYQQQEHLNRLKDQFIVHIGHELRTPLTELYGYLELLSHDSGSEESIRTTFLEHARQGCDQLIAIVDSILHTIHVRSSANPHDATSINVASLVSDIFAGFSSQEVDKYTLLSEIDITIHVWANMQSLRQVLHNILRNAFAYCPAGATITISAQLSKEQGAASQVRLCVCDNGPGIPLEEQPLLFQYFVRLQRDLAGPIRGIGLGLYVSKQLVEYMEGRIWVESSGIAGEGSCFYILLPSSCIDSSSRSSGLFKKPIKREKIT